MNANVLIRSFGRRGISACCGLAALFGLAGCGGGDGEGSNFPKKFDSMDDAEMVAYMMKNATPDSVAHFICLASLGELQGAKIDTLANATLYAYEHYKDEDLQTFSQAYDSFAESLPLDRKMRLYKLAAEQDPMGLGYELGLKYVNDIREDHKNAETVEKEIGALKMACERSAEDSATFRRFMTGFKVALERDGSSDIPRNIYNKYAGH